MAGRICVEKNFELHRARAVPIDEGWASTLNGTARAATLVKCIGVGIMNEEKH